MTKLETAKKFYKQKGDCRGINCHECFANRKGYCVFARAGNGYREATIITGMYLNGIEKMNNNKEVK